MWVSPRLRAGPSPSATLGGIATIVGTVPNMIFVGMIEKLPEGTSKVSFAQWFLYAFPISVLLLIFCYLVIRMFHARNEVKPITLMRAVAAERTGMK